MKQCNLDIIGYWITGTGWKEPKTAPFPKLFKRFLKIIVLSYIYQLAMFGGLRVTVRKIYSKMHPVSCTNTHHDVTDLIKHGIFENTETWISWERNIIFLRNKKTFCRGGNL